MDKTIIPSKVAWARDGDKWNASISVTQKINIEGVGLSSMDAVETFLLEAAKAIDERNDEYVTALGVAFDEAMRNCESVNEKDGES